MAMTTVTPRFLLPNGWILALPFYGMVSAHLLLVYLLAAWLGLGELHYFGLYSASMVSVTALTGCIILIIYLAHLHFREKVASPITRLAEDCRWLVRQPRILISVVAAMTALPLFIASFTAFKSMMPLINPFHMDPLLAEIDRWMHFGIDPWILTHAVFGGTWGTYFMGGAYFLWFPALWGFFVWHAIRVKEPFERHRYLLSFVLCWTVIGSVMAVMMMSGGPVYYDRIVGDDQAFAPLMERLQSIHRDLEGHGLELMALRLQEDLWVNLSARSLSMGTGISAMPSMHVSISVLMALAAWRANRIFGCVMWGFALVIQIGSVHLAWHYAIDGYLAAVVTVAIWWASGKIVGWLGAIESRLDTTP